MEDSMRMTRLAGVKTKLSYYKSRMLAMARLTDNMDVAYKKFIPIDPTATGYDKTLHELREKAWSYLILSLDGPPLELVRVVPLEDPHAAWNLLVQKYEPTDVEAAAAILQDMDNCELEDIYGDPTPWVTQLQTLNSRLTPMGGNYVWSDIQIIALILNKLPRDLYDGFIMTINAMGYS